MTNPIQTKTQSYIEVVCLHDGRIDGFHSYASERFETVEQALAKIAKNREPRGTDYDNYWLNKTYAIRRVTEQIDYLLISDISA